jgi:hypothetical protein
MRGLIAILAIGWACSAWSLERPKGMPHLLPDATSAQIWLELSRLGYSPFRQQNPLTRTPVDDAIDLGVRNLNWLKFINDRRPENDKISLTSASSTGGYPIEKPSEYSPKIVKERLDKLRAEMPIEMKEVLFDGKAFTPDLPLEKDKFIEWGRSTDKLYQTALRWKGMEPWLSYLEANREEDVRGIYFFNKMDPAVRAARLAAPGTWSPQEKSDFSEWLVSLCLNNGKTLSVCRQQVNSQIGGGLSALPLFDSWKVKAQATWDRFFDIQNPRSDIVVPNSDLLEMPFRDPRDAAVLAFLRDNIEDEWRFGPWKLKMVFSANAAAHVVFQPGVTPHVNGLGGDRITMNADQPMTEYDAQWTIRHEFGHVIGMPDCYIEFYDSDRQSIVNYQLDIDNLMCSRHGHIQQKHVDELLRVYKLVEPSGLD